MSSANFWAKTSVALLKTLENIAREAIEARVIGVKINVGIQLQVSDYKKFKLDRCNQTPTWSRADYVTNRRAENQSRLRILL